MNVEESRNKIEELLTAEKEFKKEVHDKLSSNYDADIGLEYEQYPDKIKALKGTKVLDRSTADVLSGVAPSDFGLTASVNQGAGGPDNKWLSVYSGRQRATYPIRTLNRYADKKISYNDVSVLSVSTIEKFNSWFVRDAVELNMENLSAIVKTPYTPNDTLPSFIKWLGARLKLSSINMPNLKHIDEEFFGNRDYLEINANLVISASNVGNFYELETYQYGSGLKTTLLKKKVEENA